MGWISREYPRNDNGKSPPLVNFPRDGIFPFVKPFGPAQLLSLIGMGASVWLISAILHLFIGSTGFYWDFSRIDYVLLSSLVGAALATAGAVCQTVLRNPLADPYLLGVSSGATLFAFIWRSAFVSTALAMTLGQQGFAFAGALFAASVVFFVAGGRWRLEPVTVLLSGVIVNAIAASLYLLLLVLQRKQVNSVDLLIGAINLNSSPAERWVALGIIAAGTFVLLAISGKLNVAGLPAGEAASLGVPVARVRFIALLMATLLTAIAVAISGPIGFIGLICPHLARKFVGSDMRKLLPISLATGATALCLADAITRGLAMYNSIGALPVGVITGLFGGPFFLWVLVQHRKRGEHAA